MSAVVRNASGLCPFASSFSIEENPKNSRSRIILNKDSVRSGVDVTINHVHFVLYRGSKDKSIAFDFNNTKTGRRIADKEIASIATALQKDLSYKDLSSVHAKILEIEPRLYFYMAILLPQEEGVSPANPELYEN